MTLFTCVVPVCPVRYEASHKSEQVSQLLFGELCQVVERTNDFVKVKMTYDHYEGWCQENQLEEVIDERYAVNNTLLASDWVNEIMIDGKVMHIPFGSSIAGEGSIAKHTIQYTGRTMDVERNSMTQEALQKVSFGFLNTPYLWGGRSVFGIDCSGFTQLVFKCFNIHLLRDASQQVTQGDEVKNLQDVTYGDLAFFDNEGGRITHVGILLNATTIIHASGKVRVDAIDDSGIMNANTGKRTHHLRVIKRMKTGLSGH